MMGEGVKMILRRIFYSIFFLSFLFFNINCKKDRILEAKLVLKENPSEAIKILMEEENEFPDKFETQYLLSLSYIQLNNFEKAEGVLQGSLEKKWDVNKKRLLKEKLLEVYKLIFDLKQKKEPTKAFEYLKKSAEIEKELRTRSVWANHKLFELYAKGVEEARKAGNFESAMENAKKINELYYIEEVKKRFVEDYRIYHKENFKKNVLKIIEQGIGKRLEGIGKYNPSTRIFIIRNKFSIPDGNEDPLFDQTKEYFEINVRKAACLPLLNEISNLLNIIAEALSPQLKVSNNEVEDLFAISWNTAIAGYEEKGGVSAKNKAGLIYICEIKLKEDDVIDKLYKILPKTP